MTDQAKEQDQADQDDVKPGLNPENGMPVKLTNWANQPDLPKLKQHLEDARPIHAVMVGKVSEWLDNHHIRGKAKPVHRKGKSGVQPQLIRKQAEWRYPALSEPFLSTDDLYKVKPVGWEDKNAAIQNELVLNYQFRAHINRVRFIDELVRSGTDEGTAIVKVGWEFKQEERTTTEPAYRYVVDAGFAPMIQVLDQMKAQEYPRYLAEVPPELRQAHDLSKDQGQPVRPMPLQDQTNEVTRKHTLCNRPTLEVCDYRNVVIDPTCNGDISKAMFVIHSFETNMAKLQEDGRYKNLNYIQVTNNSPLNEPDHAATNPGALANFNFQDKPRAKFVAYEYWGYWDIDGTGLVKPIVATWVGNTLIRLEENPFPDKALPFVVIQHLPVRHATHGEPDGALLTDNQKIIGAVTRGMVDIMARSANGQTGMRKDMLDVTNKRKFEQGEDYEFNAGVDPRQGVHQHVYPEIPQSAPLMLQLQNADAESLTGVKSFSQGVSGNSLGEVAAGVRGALDASSKRELAILRRYKAGIIEIGRKLIAMNAEFLSETEVIRITNGDFVAINRDDLAGNFDLELDISTAEENAAKAQELSFMLQTLGPNADPGERKMILAEIARLRKMPDLAKRIETYEPQPDPMEVQKAQLEMALLQSQIALNNAQAASYGANANLHNTKIGTEQARADHIKAQTDKTNLDYVEQESGVAQARDLEKVHATAQANVAGQQALQGQKAVDDANHAVLQHQLDDKLSQNDMLRQYNASKQK